MKLYLLNYYNKNNKLPIIDKTFINTCIKVQCVENKDSNLTVIDIDVQDKGMVLWNKLIEKHGEIDTRIDSTPSGGLHYYFKYCDKVKHKTKHTVGGYQYGIDVLNKKLCIMAPTFRGPKFKKKEGYYKNINNNDINEMTEWLINWIIKHQSLGTEIKSINKSPNIIKLYIVAYYTKNNKNWWY